MVESNGAITLRNVQVLAACDARCRVVDPLHDRCEWAPVLGGDEDVAELKAVERVNVRGARAAHAEGAEDAEG